MAACFEAMRLPAVRFGDDPWGVLVKAVMTTFRAAEFADDALTSLDTARRGGLSGCRVERFCERETSVWERDPGFAFNMPDNLGETTESGSHDRSSIQEQAEQLAGLFAAHGWASNEVAVHIELVMRLLAEYGSRPRAYEVLRRSQHWRVFTGLPARSWTGLLRILLGKPGGPGNLGKGILVRVQLGETIAHLEADNSLVAMIRDASPASKDI